MFINVIDFFNETWKHKPKPYKLNEYLLNKKKLQNSEVVRDTSIQPTVFYDKDGKPTYNKRKLSEFPLFISQLRANLSNPFICEFVFYNYTFLTGLCLFKLPKEIMDLMQKFSEGSSYSLTPEAKDAANEIKLMSLIMLQCLFNMVECPLSACSQVLSRTLIFYGHLKYLTSMVDQYDADSMRNCALITAYQIFSPPAADLIFSFEGHIKPITAAVIGGDNDSHVFSLSDKVILFNMNTASNQGQMKLPTTNSPFLMFVVYFNQDTSDDQQTLKDINGGFIAASTKEIVSYSFQNNLYFHKIFSEDDETIKDISLLSSNHFMVTFNEKNYLNIYNIFTGELVIHQVFDKRITLTNTDLNKCGIQFFTVIKSVFVIVALEHGEIKAFNSLINNDRKNMIFEKKTDNQIRLDLILEIPACGYDCYSIKFCLEQLVLTLADGSLIDLYLEKNGQTEVLNYCRPNMAASEHVKFQLIVAKSDSSFKSHILYVLIGSNGHVYILFIDSALPTETVQSRQYFIEIPGSFDNATVISRSDDNLKLTTFNKGLIVYYLIKLNHGNNTYSYVRFTEVQAHFDQVSFFFQKGLFFRIHLF